jgi:hypothetical protein
MRGGREMKPHADQRARDAERNDTLQCLNVTRLQTPFLDYYLHGHGDFACILAMKREGGEQCNYSMKLDGSDMGMMNLGPQSAEREFMPDCYERELKTMKKRAYAVEYLARKIAAGMIDFLERNDPQFGYSPKEWEDTK